MTCYSSQYIGDKIWTYTVETEKLLSYLVRKIERKFELKSKHTIFSRGYSTNPQELTSLRLNNTGYTIKENNLNLSLAYYPLIYFDFRYSQETLKKDWWSGISSWEEYMLQPYDVVDDLMESAMIQSPPIILDNQKHSSNVKYFRLIIPLNYYKYNKDLTYENKKRQTVIKDNQGFRLIFRYLTTNYKDIFTEITYIPNYYDNRMEYYLYYTGTRWSTSHIRELKYKILESLYNYCIEKNITKEYKQCTLFITYKK